MLIGLPLLYRAPDLAHPVESGLVEWVRGRDFGVEDVGF